MAGGERGGKPAPMPNHLLRWARVERGWSCEELARQVVRSMAEDDDPRGGLSGETVRRWEVGHCSPTSTYRKHLVKVLDRSASQLGLLSASELASRPATEPREPADDDRLAGLVAEATTRVLRMMRGDGRVVSRRILVRGMLAGGLLGASALPRPAVSARHALDPRAVAEMAAITVAHERLYYTSDPTFLLDAVLSHLQVGVGLLSQPQSESSNFRALAGSVAESALLAARIAFFDLGDAELAEDCFSLASRAVESAKDHALCAAVRAHQAFVPGFSGHASDARVLLDAAQAQVRLAPGPRLRSWIHCVAAEISARTGNATGGLRHIRQAEQALASSGEDPRWLDFFDESRWAGFAGQVYLVAGQASQAVTHLRQALGQLGDDGQKQRSVLLLDLACAQGHDDAAEAAATAHEAFDALATAPYDAATARFPQLVNVLSATPFADKIQERIRALSAR